MQFQLNAAGKRICPSEFKAKVLEDLRGGATPHELGRRHGIPIQEIVNWRRSEQVAVLGKSHEPKADESVPLSEYRMLLEENKNLRRSLVHASLDRDILELRCWNGEKVFITFSLDCCDREVMSYVAERRPLFHGDIIKLIDQTVTHRFGEFVEKLPQAIQWLSDQGPQYKAIETVAYGSAWGFGVRTTPAYSPESNGMTEGFVKLFKCDYAYVNELWTAESVPRSLPEWFADYNQPHPHSGLKMKSPLEYREAVRLTEDVSV